MTDAEPREIAFGDFRILPSRRLLLSGNRPVRVGSRAFDLLMALVERPGELVPKGELVARIWPSTYVDETNLRVHLAALRKILGDGIAGVRYVANEPGRGYRFVAPVSTVERPQVPAPEAAAEVAGAPLPTSLVRVVGRDEIVGRLAAQLSRSPFLSIVGPAGIGKTTVAVMLAETLARDYQHGLCFVDLSVIRSGSAPVPGAVAAALGLPVHSQSPLPEILTHLATRRQLLVLDGCDAVLDAVAQLAEAVLRVASGVHIVATSREPLRMQGERVVRLPPLPVPDGTRRAAAEALGHAAVELFVERAAAVLDGYELTDADAPVVSDICRRLDGIPLAIELAAGRIDAFGVHGLAELLDDHFRILTSGRRRALPRHQTLAAALDWSYDLLTPPQAALFRRLAVFAGGFALDAVLGVAAVDEPWQHETMTLVASLVAKSLLAADVSGNVTIYRLLDTTRAYALRKLEENGERQETSRRHAVFNLHSQKLVEANLMAPPTGGFVDPFRVLRLENGRAALDWAFSADGDPGLGAALTAASVMMWMDLSLVDECRVRVERAIAQAPTGDSQEDRHLSMRLHAALGQSLMFTRGASAETVEALERTLELADALGDDEYALRALWGLWVARLNNGAIPLALVTARRFAEIASRTDDPLNRAISDRMVGFSLHFLGENAEARRHMERMLQSNAGRGVRSHVYRFQFDQWSTARATLAESLWIQGFGDQAIAAARAAWAQAEAIGHAVTTCNTLAKASVVALHAGDLELAADMIAAMRDTAASHSLRFWQAEGGCLDGVRRIHAGDLHAGIAGLTAELRGFPGSTLIVRYIAYLGELADALSRLGQAADADAALAEALDRCERNSERWCVAELLRIKGDIAVRTGHDAAADTAYAESLDWSRRQGALGWELRTAISLARKRIAEGQPDGARAHLAPVLARFTEGFATADLRAAARILEEC